jgi:PqqD family protein of HPr-rel-A system
LPLRRGDVESTSLDDQWLLLDRASGNLHVLNATAGRVWALCDGEHSPSAIAERLRVEFAIAPSKDATADVVALLADLRQLGLLL